MIQTKSFIEEGDIITNCQEYEVVIDSVEKGRNGLLLRGKFCCSGNTFLAFAPYELSPIEESFGWYNWTSANWMTLTNGLKTGIVGVWKDQAMSPVSYYDTIWDETLELMRKEREEVE